MADKNQNSGFFEELHYANRDYPEHKRFIPLKPSDFPEVFTQYIAQKIKLRFESFAEHEQYEKIVELYSKLEKFLDQTKSDLETPVAKVQYWFDQEQLPIFPPDVHLTQPALVTNQDGKSNNFLSVLKSEMITADRVDFVVSFVRQSGVQKLIRTMIDLLEKGKQVRIITSTYLNISQSAAFRMLLKLQGLQVKIYQTDRVAFHTKAYIFHRNSGQNSVVIGSSNISMSALEEGVEWNVKLPADVYASVFDKANLQFEQLWNSTQLLPLTAEWLKEYEDFCEQNKHVQQTNMPVFRSSIADSRSVPYVTDKQITSKIELKLTPNQMQRDALQALQITRENGQTKGVIIAATGTGKTYLAAFDVAHFAPKRLLFLAHRDELLENAKQSFINVMGAPENFGKLTGIVKQRDKPYLFSTVQTFYRELDKFSKDYFDYIIVDEFHHAEAATYRIIIDYFEPKFLLGLTATPERMDGGDVLAICDYNVVYEIRLHQALNEGLLCPFHYFGLSDDTVDYSQIRIENGQFNIDQLARALSKTERVDYIVSMIDKFGHDGRQRKALAFCASVEHARFMAHSFNRLGLVSACLTGEDVPSFRQETIRRLESDSDPLEFIFTVNIFNEGVDIPELNLLLFLRPTESATVFLQQLGRGLRKTDNKEFVTILDFIGNYSKSFLVPLALSGQTNHKAFDRDLLRTAVQSDFVQLPEGCYVDLEQIARQQILDKIDQIRMDSSQMLKNLYDTFKEELGKSPEIEDFLYASSAPSLHYFLRKFSSWVETKKRMNDSNSFDEKILETENLLLILRRLERMLPIKWPYEFLILQACLQNRVAIFQEVNQLISKQFGIEVNVEKQLPYIIRAANKLSENVRGISFGESQKDKFVMDPIVLSFFTNSIFSKYLRNRLDFGIKEFRRTYRPQVFFEGEIPVVPYLNYTRDELIYLFQSDAAPGSWREGISRVNNHYLFFVTLRKGEDVAEQLDYKDYFMNQRMFHWQSANQTSHESTRGQDYIHHEHRAIHIHLFVRKFEKMYSQTLPFMYCGELNYVRSDGDRPMNIVWRLTHPLPEDIYLDFIS